MFSRGVKSGARWLVISSHLLKCHGLCLDPDRLAGPPIAPVTARGQPGTDVEIASKLGQTHPRPLAAGRELSRGAFDCLQASYEPSLQAQAGLMASRPVAPPFTQALGPPVLVAVLLVIVLVTPVRADVDTVFVVPGAHLDVGFNDLPSVVREHRIRAIEDALHAAAGDSIFHWTEDCAWGFGGWLQRFRGDVPRMAAARSALQNGQLGVSAAWVSPHGSMFHESLGLLTAHLDETERLLGQRPQVAVLDDTPSQPEAVIDALTARGVRYMLVGANMFITDPLPPRLVRSPFWWESSKGARVLAYIDPNSYCQAASWLTDTDTVRFADPVRFPRDRVLLATAERGFRKLLAETTSRYGALVFQHAFDDWGVSAVDDLPGFVRTWNAAGMRPCLVLSSPAAYFRHIEARYGAELPVYRGEWGGQWDCIRAACPAWTWRLREAMRLTPLDAPVEVKEALATAMDHGLTLGPGWPGMFTEEQTIGHAREQAGVFARAVEAASHAALQGAAPVSLVDALPPPLRVPEGSAIDAVWREVLADSAEVRVRVGPGEIAPFISNTAPAWDVPLKVGIRGSHLAACARIDRGGIPGAETALTFVVMELPFRAPAGRVRIAPADSPSAIGGVWLRGEPPRFVVAPEGLRVSGLSRPLRVTSPLAFSYALVADPLRANVTWLQVLLVRQEMRCELKGNITRILPFGDLYPGEPEALDMGLEVEMLDE